MLQAVGAIPVTIEFAELYTALAQHTVDGFAINNDGVISQKFDTVITHIAMANQHFSFIPLLGSKRKIDALPPELQKLLHDEATATLPAWRALTAQQLVQAEQTLRGKGIVFTEIDLPAFRKAMEPVYASFQSKIGGDLFERVRRAANA